MKNDIYKTLQQPSESIFRDKGSKFLGYAFSVSSETDVQNHLEILRKMHPKARHWCYAYRIGLKGTQFRANDDGEPSGSAGRPILGRIDSFGLSNVLVVVVRYFGGTLLGVSGLKNAYKQAAAAALSNAVLIEKVVKDLYSFTFEYALLSQVMNALKSQNIEIFEKDFSSKGRVIIGIRSGRVAETIHQLKAAIAEEHLENINEQTEIPGLTIEFLNRK